MRRDLAMLVVLTGLTIMLGGCFRAYGPKAGKDWTGKPAIAENLERIPPGQGRLQIITGYTPPLFSHAALRLVTPDHGTVFWDPGGDFAKQDSDAPRQSDLIVRPPALGQYIVFRLDMLGDKGGEIFEWNLDRDTAERLYNALVHGRQSIDPEGKFDTYTIPSQCSLKVCEFAIRFAPNVVGISKRELYPYDLAQMLWRRQPDRVIVYQRDQPLMVYTRPD